METTSVNKKPMKMCYKGTHKKISWFLGFNSPWCLLTKETFFWSHYSVIIHIFDPWVLMVEKITIWWIMVNTTLLSARIIAIVQGKPSMVHTILWNLWTIVDTYVKLHEKVLSSSKQENSSYYTNDSLESADNDKKPSPTKISQRRKGVTNKQNGALRNHPRRSTIQLEFQFIPFQPMDLHPYIDSALNNATENSIMSFKMLKKNERNKMWNNTAHSFFKSIRGIDTQYLRQFEENSNLPEPVKNNITCDVEKSF